MLHNNISNIADIFIVIFVIMDAVKICYKKYLTTSKQFNATNMLQKCYIKYCYNIFNIIQNIIETK